MKKLAMQNDESIKLGKYRNGSLYWPVGSVALPMVLLPRWFLREDIYEAHC